VFSPEVENSFGSLESAASGKVKDSSGAARDLGLIKVGRSESSKVAGRVELAKDGEGVLTFTKDVIDLLESGEVAMGEALLVWNEDIGFGRGEPAGEDTLEKEIGVEGFFATKPICQNRNPAAVAHGDFVSGSGCGLMDEIDITVQSHAVAPGDDVKMSHGI